MVRLDGNERIADLTPVVITAATAILNLTNFNETIGSLASTAAGKVTLGSGVLTAGGNNLSTTNSCVISGTGGFIKKGSGTLIFTGANTYTSNTVVAAGTLQLGASELIANTSPLVISNGATFNMTWNGTNYSETVASLAGAGSVVLGTTLTAGTTSTTTFSGGISGAGAFTKVGTGCKYSAAQIPSAARRPSAPAICRSMAVRPAARSPDRVCRDLVRQWRGWNCCREFRRDKFTWHQRAGNFEQRRGDVGGRRQLRLGNQ